MSTALTFDNLREPALLLLAFAAGVLTGFGIARWRAARMPTPGKFHDGIDDSKMDDKSKPVGGIFRPKPQTGKG